MTSWYKSNEIMYIPVFCQPRYVTNVHHFIIITIVIIFMYMLLGIVSPSILVIARWYSQWISYVLLKFDLLIGPCLVQKVPFTNFIISVLTTIVRSGRCWKGVGRKMIFSWILILCDIFCALFGHLCTVSLALKSWCWFYKQLYF